MKPFVVIGHSLGAGRGAEISALAALAGRPATALVNFGEPHPGYAKLIGIIASAGTRALPHCNGDAHGHDLVTDVPFVLPIFPYEHTAALISVSEPPAASDRSFFRYHHMPLYAAAVKRSPINVVGAFTTSDAAEIANATYGNEPITWDRLDDGSDSDGVYWGLKETPDVLALAFRGSVTLEDWLRDMLAVPAPWGDAQLGCVHPGFLLGMRQVWAEFSALLPWPPA